MDTQYGNIHKIGSEHFTDEDIQMVKSILKNYDLDDPESSKEAKNTIKNALHIVYDKTVDDILGAYVFGRLGSSVNKSKRPENLKEISNKITMKMNHGYITNL